jgi:hypothetical protein
MHDADTAIARLPRAPAVFGGVDAAGRNGYAHPFRFLWVKQDRVQRQPAQSRHPARTVRMVE